MTREGLTALASLLEKNYQHRNFRVDAELLTFWAAHLEPYDDATTMRAVVAYTARSPHPPTIADLLRELRGDPRDAERLLDEEAESALVVFEREFADFEVVDYGPIINKVVADLGGPDTIGLLMVRDEWKFHRDEFRTLYKVYRRRAMGNGPPVPRNVVENVQAGNPMPLPRRALFIPPSIPGLPTLPGTTPAAALPPGKGDE